MRIGILPHSFSSAFEIYKVVPGHEVFIILSPSPHRSAWTSYLANLARILRTTLKGLKLLTTGRLILLRLDHRLKLRPRERMTMTCGAGKQILNPPILRRPALCQRPPDVSQN